MNKQESILAQLTDKVQHLHLPFSSGNHTFKNVGGEERLASGVGGALLATLGLRKADTAGLVMTVLGSILLFRAATGYCPANEALGRNTTHA